MIRNLNYFLYKLCKDVFGKFLHKIDYKYVIGFKNFFENNVRKSKPSFCYESFILQVERMDSGRKDVRC